MSATDPSSESSSGTETEGSATPPQRDEATPSPAAAETSPSASDTPQAGATTSDASSASETKSESPPEASDRTPDDAGETSAEASGSETDDGDAEDGETDGAEGAAQPTADAQAPGGAPKKQRRRRKKKGGGAGADASGAPQGDRPAQGDRQQAGKQSDRPRRERTRHRASDRAPFHVGEEVFGKVTAVLDTAIMVNLSGKALAIFDRTEMEADDLVPTQGDKFVARIHNDGARGGLVVLTRKPLREEETKPKLEQAFKDGTLVLGLITGAIKGGVEVDIGGVRAFAPASGMDLHPANANFTALVGQPMEFKVTQFDKAGRDVVVTRRPMLEAEAHERRKHALGLLQAGQVTPGVVRTVVEWGVFVALPEAENVEGLVHVSEATHDPQANLFELFKHGDRFDVKILEIDDRGKIWLSRKALVEDPWGVARKQYAPGTRHKGKVVKLERFGAFVALESGIDGLLHISDLSFDRIDHPKDVLTDGQELEVVVHYFDARSKKIGLHLAPPPEQAGEAPQRVSKNALVKVAVVKGESAGLIVRILGATGRAARGFVPAGQTGTPRGTDLRKAFKVGTLLDTKVVEVDPRSGEPKLSIRGFKEDEERRAHREYRKQAEGRRRLRNAGGPPPKQARQSHGGARFYARRVRRIRPAVNSPQARTSRETPNGRRSQVGRGPTEQQKRGGAGAPPTTRLRPAEQRDRDRQGRDKHYAESGNRTQARAPMVVQWSGVELSSRSEIQRLARERSAFHASSNGSRVGGGGSRRRRRVLWIARPTSSEAHLSPSRAPSAQPCRSGRRDSGNVRACVRSARSVRRSQRAVHLDLPNLRESLAQRDPRAENLA